MASQIDPTLKGALDKPRDQVAKADLKKALQTAKDELTSLLTGEVGNPSLSRSISIASPSASEDRTIFYTPVEITVSELRAVLVGDGASPSVEWTVRFAKDRSAVGTEVASGGATTTNVAEGDSITNFTNETIPADSFVWVETFAATDVAELHITVVYTE